MDTLAHGLWSFLLFHKQRWKYWALFFGLLPDLSSWTIYLFYNIITGSFARGPPDPFNVPDWVWTLYGLSHSIFIFMIVFVALWLIFKKIQWIIIPWIIHILMDVPTHSREFLPTPFLWPISTWYFPGFSWGNGWFLIPNYSLLIIGYLYFFVYMPLKGGRSAKKEATKTRNKPKKTVKKNIKKRKKK
jgi:hypothetical protein